MKNKLMNLIVMAFAMLLCYTAAIYSEPIEVLFKHREYLKRWAEECDAFTGSGKQHVLLFSEMDQKKNGLLENK
jgi:hypothetical protein